MSVGESVNHAVDGVEAVGDEVEILRVARVVTTENRVGNVIRNLDKTRGFGIREKRRVGYILE
jgi:hypothetical protein